MSVESLRRLLCVVVPVSLGFKYEISSLKSGLQNCSTHSFDVLGSSFTFKAFLSSLKHIYAKISSLHNYANPVLVAAII